MNRGMGIGGIVILILIGAGLFFANQQTNSGKMTQQKAEMASDDASMEEKAATEKDDTAMQKTMVAMLSIQRQRLMKLRVIEEYSISMQIGVPPVDRLTQTLKRT